MKNRSPISLLLTLLVLLILGSCEDVIHLDLKNTAPRLVIDATLDASSGGCDVRVTRSVDFYHTDSFSRVEDAGVVLYKGSVKVSGLPQTEPGVYRITGVQASPGDTIRLEVSLPSGDRFAAESVVPRQVGLDSLKVIRGIGDPRPSAPPVYLINAFWRDPAGVPDYYRFKVIKNGKERNRSFFIVNDESFDGTETELPLYRFSFDAGDTVNLEFQSIDSASFSYFNQINDMARPSFVSAAPYNPVGNFDNGALGYFGIFFTESHDLIIRPGK
jgi:hypothetical protein